MRNPCTICGTDCSGPGKFEGNECQVVAGNLYDVVGDGGHKDECGDCGTTGWYALILEATAPDTSAAYIVWENSQGFFAYDSYPTVAAAREEWAHVQTDCETDEGGQS